MQSDSLSKLETAAQKISESKTPEERLEAFSESYQLFAKTTLHLEKSYHLLEKQFQKIKEQLQTTNDELRQKIVELDIAAYYLNSILLNMSQGLIFIGMEGLVTTYNAAAEQIMGIDRLQVLFQPFAEVFADEIFGFSMKKALETGDVPPLSYVTLPPNQKNLESRQIAIETNFILKKSLPTQNFHPSPLFDLAKGLIILIRDVTKLQQLEKQIHQRDRMKELGEMISLISHEIRNPLGGVRGYASLLVEEVASNPDAKQMADKLLQGIDRLYDVLNRIINYSRPFEIHQQTVSLNSLIEETANHAKLDERKPINVHILVEVPEQTIFAPLDSSLIRSCLLNLAVNSFDAMPKGGKLIFHLEQKSGEVEISISDTGEGIPQENLGKLFQLFFTTKPKGKGTGFGLAEVSRIILAHHGTIHVNSEVGKGTTFIITLPLGNVQYPGKRQ